MGIQQKDRQDIYGVMEEMKLKTNLDYHYYERQLYAWDAFNKKAYACNPDLNGDIHYQAIPIEMLPEKTKKKFKISDLK